MSTTVPKLLTADEFWHSPLNGKHVELVRGEVEVGMPTGGRHGLIQVKLGGRLDVWATANSAGYVGSEAGFMIAREPDTVRAPDLAFVRRERFPSAGVPDGYWQIAPDLAVEVVSPSESADQLRTKVAEHFEAGASEVWLIFPLAREIEIRHPDGSARTIQMEDDLTSVVLPGFSCRVSELFSQ